MTLSPGERIIKNTEFQTHDEDHDEPWVCIGGIVYDVKDYQFEHPGGSSVLVEQAGKDGTAEFLDAGHTPKADVVMKTLRIGVLEGVEPREPEELRKERKEDVPDLMTKKEGEQKVKKNDQIIVYILGMGAMAVAGYALYRIWQSKQE